MDAMKTQDWKEKAKYFQVSELCEVTTLEEVNSALLLGYMVGDRESVLKERNDAFKESEPCQR